MSDKIKEKEGEEEKEGELNVDILDAAFDDHGFGEEDVPLISIIKGDEEVEEDDGGAEWRDDSIDDKDNW